MNVVTFTLYFLLLAVVGALIISGWYIVTRGRMEVMPDGSLERRGMLLRGWSLYWNRIIGYEKKYYAEQPLFDLIFDFKQDLTAKYYYGSSCLTYKQSFLPHGVLQTLKKRGIKVESNDAVYDDSNYEFYFYKLVPTYYFPIWIRKPLANCPVCFAGIYGVSFYIMMVCQIGEHYLFAWCEANWFMEGLFGVFYCLSVATLNKLINKVDYNGKYAC